MTKSLRSDRLTLVASTATHVRTELEAPERLALLLDAAVSPEWPSGEYDRDAMEFFLSRFEEDGEGAEGWYGWYALGSSIVGMLAQHSFTFPDTVRIIAHTTADNSGSIKVLERCGFLPVGSGAETGNLRFERLRATGLKEKLA